MALVLVLAVIPALSQTRANQTSPVDPLPQDSGGAGLRLMLLRLNTTARLMHTTAHPDDEDGGLLTLESRGKGVNTLLLTLNRGEGGQNIMGSNLFDVLGVLRTLELLGSDRYYGVEQRFTRVADFGFSKNPDETFEKWGGHNAVLADMVRVIRRFRPDVLPADDYGIRKGFAAIHGLAAPPTPKALDALGEIYRPYRSVAAWYCWRAVDTILPTAAVT